MIRFPLCLLLIASAAVAQKPKAAPVPPPTKEVTQSIDVSGGGYKKLTTPTPRKADEFIIHRSKKASEDILLSSFRGKPVLLALMHAGCPHCQDLTRKVLHNVVNEYGPKGLQVVGAVFEDKDDMRFKTFITGTGVNFPLGYSTATEVLAFLHIAPNTKYYVPMLLFIDKTGIIRSAYLGDIDFLEHEDVNVRKEADKLLAGSK